MHFGALSALATLLFAGSMTSLITSRTILLASAAAEGDCIDCAAVNGDLAEVDYQMMNDQVAAPLSDNRQGLSGDCRFPCNCSKPEPRCKAGVHLVQDGCECCAMCARQQGDMCNHRDRCDEEKGLVCDLKLDGGIRGICRAKSGKPCQVNGTVYQDGDQFSPSCSLLCTCQDGRYACSTKCPQELRAPSVANCRDAQLVAIKGRCCREWVCPRPAPHSFNEPDELVSDQFNNKSPSDGERCNRETTAWSGCSVTCGMGESIRVTSDNPECQPIQERRLCQIRPCDAPSHPLRGKKCKSTWLDNVPRRLQYAECESEETYTLKFCTNCKRRKCCGPHMTRMAKIQFHCPEKKLLTKSFVFIETCKCYPLEDCPFL